MRLRAAAENEARKCMIRERNLPRVVIPAHAGIQVH